MEKKKPKTVFKAPLFLPLAKSESKTVYHQVVVRRFMLEKPVPLPTSSGKK